MKDKYIKIFRKLKFIYQHPVSCWSTLDKEPDSPAWYFKNLVTPFVLAITVVNFLGYLFFALAIQEYSILYALVKAVAVFCESFFTFYVAFLIIKELKVKLKVEIDDNKLFKIMVYAITPLWSAILLSGFFANYATLSSFLKFMGIYGVFLFAAGLEQLHLVDSNKRSQFTFITFGIILIIYQLISWSFSFALKAIQYADILSK